MKKEYSLGKQESNFLMFAQISITSRKNGKVKIKIARNEGKNEGKKEG